MSKEISGTGTPVGVFALMGRGAHYEDNLVTPLPMPPDTANIGRPVFVSAPLKRSASQPVLSQSGVTSTLVKPEMTKDDMRLATGAVTATKPDGQGFVPSTNFDYNSVALRYDTNPQYRSNTILSTFHHEFQSFGHRSQAGENGSRKHEQLAVPSHQLQSQTSNANVSSPSKTFAFIKQCGFNALIPSAASRSLTRLTEEKAEEGSDNGGKEVVERDSGHLERLQTGHGKSSLTNMPPPINPIDPSAACTEKLQITKTVIDWLHGPNTKVNASRTEMNVFSPSSF